MLQLAELARADVAERRRLLEPIVRAGHPRKVRA